MSVLGVKDSLEVGVLCLGVLSSDDFDGLPGGIDFGRI